MWLSLYIKSSSLRMAMTGGGRNRHDREDHPFWARVLIRVVMFWLWLGLKAMALTRLWVALAR
jgi:hypothetical protein